MNRKNITHYHSGIRIDQIPAKGTGGLLFTLATIVTFMAVPEVREFFLIGLAGGIPTALALYYWHNQTRW